MIDTWLVVVIGKNNFRDKLVREYKHWFNVKLNGSVQTYLGEINESCCVNEGGCGGTVLLATGRQSAEGLNSTKGGAGTNVTLQAHKWALTDHPLYVRIRSSACRPNDTLFAVCGDK